MKRILSATTALVMIFGAVSAAPPAPPQNDHGPQGRDPYGYYSVMDQEGFYDRDGHYVRFADQRRVPRERADDGPGAAPPARIYSRGDYESRCKRGNTAAGTIFGAIAGGLIGGAASSGRHHGADAGAVIGGIILGGLIGNAVTRDLPCEDHGHAFRTYADGLNGRVGMRYSWRNDETGDYGYFTPEREFNRERVVCRSFHETTYINGRRFDRSGTACRQDDGNWHFD